MDQSFVTSIPEAKKSLNIKQKYESLCASQGLANKTEGDPKKFSKSVIHH